MNILFSKSIIYQDFANRFDIHEVEKCHKYTHFVFHSEFLKKFCL